MLSYWEEKYWFDDHDAVIVGSGYVGLSTAIHIKQNNPDTSVLVIDRSVIPSGASTKNAGFACFGSIGELMDDLDCMEEKEVVETIRMRWEGLRYMEAFIDYELFSLENTGGYEVFTSSKDYFKTAENISYINNLMQKAVGKDDVFCIRNIDYSGFYNNTIFNKYEAALNPVLLLRGLLRKAKSYDIRLVGGFSYHTHRATKDQIIISLDKGLEIRARKLFFCNNAFAHRFLRDVDITPCRNQVIISKPLDNLEVYGTYHFDRGYIYFRNIGNDRILIGGGRNHFLVAETTDRLETNSEVIKYLENFAKKYIRKDFELDSSWSGIIASGKSKKPTIKRIEENVYAGVRLGGMGVAIGIQVGKQLAELLET